MDNPEFREDSDLSAWAMRHPVFVRGAIVLYYVFAPVTALIELIDSTVGGRSLREAVADIRDCFTEVLPNAWRACGLPCRPRRCRLMVSGKEHQLSAASVPVVIPFEEEVGTYDTAAEARAAAQFYAAACVMRTGNVTTFEFRYEDV